MRENVPPFQATTVFDLEADAKSVTRPAESHNIFMFRTLCYLPATCISKHEGDVILGIDLENMNHSPPATRAMRIFDVLDPSGPACELVAKLTVGDRLGQIAVVDLL